MSKTLVIKSDTAPATAKLVTRLAGALCDMDNLLSEICGKYGKCEPGGCPLYPTQDELDGDEYPRGCKWVNLNSELITFVMESYRDWRDRRDESYIAMADDMEDMFTQIAEIEEKD